MDNQTVFFICPVCFRVCDTETECHQHRMVACDPGEFGDERRKPLTDEHGHLVSRAPRWFMEAVGWIQSQG